MCLRMSTRLLALEYLFDQVNAAAGPIEFIAGKLVGWAGGIAETAVHAITQDAICLFSVMSFEIVGSDRGLHSSLYNLAGFRMLMGSSACLMRL